MYMHMYMCMYMRKYVRMLAWHSSGVPMLNDKPVTTDKPSSTSAMDSGKLASYTLGMSEAIW